MSDANLKSVIQEHMKSAMRAKDQKRLGIIRLILSAIKQVEVDERRELSDADITGILGKMIKQRRDAKAQYETANRPELAEQEHFEITVVEEYLPKQLGDAEIEAIVTDTIAQANAEGPKDMGKVMGLIKPKLQGQADMRKVSEIIKSRLAS